MKICRIPANDLRPRHPATAKEFANHSAFPSLSKQHRVRHKAFPRFQFLRVRAVLEMCPISNIDSDCSLCDSPSNAPTDEEIAKA